MKNLISVLSFILITTGCGIKQYSVKKGEKIKQGIAGQVFELTGNQMPSPDRPRNTEGTPIKATVYVFELTNHHEQIRESGVYTTINTRKITAIKTTANGEFKIALTEGVYSLFVKVEEGYFANLYDEKMNIHPVTIKKDELTTTKIKVDYKAAY
ncbi:MAG TPA: hypothetical protein VI548_02725 [Chitinophagaceae bacterium]|nr:hypothetical protein [Chitinophagaceae bacterium]